MHGICTDSNTCALGKPQQTEVQLHWAALVLVMNLPGRLLSSLQTFVIFSPDCTSKADCATFVLWLIEVFVHQKTLISHFSFISSFGIWIQIQLKWRGRGKASRTSSTVSAPRLRECSALHRDVLSVPHWVHCNFTHSVVLWELLWQPSTRFSAVPDLKVSLMEWCFPRAINSTQEIHYSKSIVIFTIFKLMIVTPDPCLKATNTSIIFITRYYPNLWKLQVFPLLCNQQCFVGLDSSSKVFTLYPHNNNQSFHLHFQGRGWELEKQRNWKGWNCPSESQLIINGLTLTTKMIWQ